MATIAAASPTAVPVVPIVVQGEAQRRPSPVIQTQQQTAPAVARTQAPRVETPAASHRFTTKALSVAYMAISTLGAMLAYWVCPAAALTGAIAGFAWCFIEGNRNRIQETEETRASVVALIGITTLVSLYAATNPAATITSTLLGLQGAATGIYPLARDFVDGV